MSDSDFVPFLVSDRTSSLLNHIDACQFTESELVDMYMGICYRLKDLIDFKATPVYQAVQNSIEVMQQVKDDAEYNNEYLQDLRHDH